MSEQCEVCGDFVEQFVVDADGNLCGPWYEWRHHVLGNVHHDWAQLHNCVKPEPDNCRFCRKDTDWRTVKTILPRDESL